MYRLTTILFALSLAALASHGLPVRSLLTAGCPLEAPVLGEAASFTVLAGSTVTNIGATTIQGDLGVSPGSAVAGLLPDKVTGGSMHKADDASKDAMRDLTTAYNVLAGQTCNPFTRIGDIGGTTITTGLYKSTSGMEVTKGDLTLFGSANDIWIFQMASTFNIASGKKIIMSGGALAGNVYWQVGTSGTINTGSTFMGTMMADQAISVKTGATVNGRLLARIAAVTLEGNTITQEEPVYNA